MPPAVSDQPRSLNDNAPLGAWSDLRAIFSWIEPSDRVRWLVLAPIVSLAATFEALGALAVFGLLRMIVEPDRVRTAPVVSRIWQAWPRDDPREIVIALTIAVALFYVVRALFLSWSEWLKELAVHRSGGRVAERLFSRYLAAHYRFHLQRRSSSLIEEVARSTDVSFQLVAASALNIVAECATLLALVIVLLLTTPAQTVGAVALVVIGVAFPIVATRRVWLRWGERHKKFEEQQLHVLQQSLGAIKEVKIAGRESFFESRLRAARRVLSRVRQQRSWVASALRIGVETALILAMLLVVLLVMLRGESGSDTVSILAIFAYTGFRAVPSANRIMLNAGYMREGHPFARAVAADFDRLTAAPPKPHVPEPRMQFQDRITCERVSFAYEAGRVALHDIDLTIRCGESIGIVGPTGSGKSTLVDVLLGLLTPTSGRVLIDGIELRGRERGWQRLIGYVAQDPYLLDDTVRRNVAFGIPEASVDEHRLARASTLAQVDEFTRHLPQGLDTVIGEDGVRLSGGQRQRVAIARALYHDPQVLIFDEATASLDNLTEREVTGAVAALHGTRTVIVIAHRMTTVEGCDRLVFLRDGRLAGIGTYDELLRDPAFKAMALA